jgi:Flp pilus assembly protein TadG
MTHFGTTRKRRGAVIVEFALIVPFMLLIIAGIIDISRAYAQLNTINASLREGARYAAALSRPDTSFKEIKTEIRRFSAAFGTPMDTSAVTITTDAYQVAVAVTNYPISIPTLGTLLRGAGLTDVLQVSRTVSFRWERTGMP